MRRDEELWSGCLSGAYREDRFLEAFERAGFQAVELAARGETPWRVVDGIEFRSVTVTARKGQQRPGAVGGAPAAGEEAPVPGPGGCC